MADVRLSVENVSRQGLNAAYTSVNSTDNYLVNNDGYVILHVKNTDAAAETVTLTTARTINGLTIQDPTVNVPAGEDRFIGPFAPGVYNDNQDLQVGFSNGTATTVAVLRVS